MKSLAELVTVATRYARSANLERDAQAGEALDGYVLTGRVLEMLDRLATAATRGTGGAWSITGPYGSGKSSLGVFLDALFGPTSTGAFKTATRLLSDVDGDLANKVMHARNGAGERGYARALVTAHAEPVTHTVTRALHRAVQEHFGRYPTTRQLRAAPLLTAALDDIAGHDPKRTGPAPGSLIEIACNIAEIAPLLMVIDEFGKNLEAAQQRTDADLYLLQLLAEAAQTNRGAPIFVLTMQHLAFGEYAASAESAQQREWAKIQGRFEDIVFVDSAAQTRQLIARAFTADASLTGPVRTWAAAQAKLMASLHLYELADTELLAACYPLHPLALAVLPELCRRYGQNERTLFAFLTGNNAAAIPARLRDMSPSKSLPTVGLAEVYDFFVQAASSTPTGGATRWSEISLRLRDIAGLSPAELAVAKNVAILNLLSTAGPQRASRQILAAAHPAASEHLAALEDAGVVVYRDTTDEYRVWQGTGLDLTGIVDRHRTIASQRTPVELLPSAAPLGPVIATGHSMRTDTLRTFDRRYIASPADIAALSPGTVYDGIVYISLDPTMAPPTSAPKGLPVVVQIPSATDALIDAAIEVHALQLALRDPAVIAEWVARTELQERLVAAIEHLTLTFDTAVNTGLWYLLDADGPVPLSSRTSFDALSEVADRCYSKTVAVRNETLNRVELSSQGAKARRLLLLAMLENEQVERLGLEGHGPEVAMYTALLAHTQMHRFDDRHERWAIRPPKDDALLYAWKLIEAELRGATDRRVSLSDIHAVLQLPPIGMKAGAIPVLVIGVLISTSDEVALYEHGTFRPVLTAEVCDRMVRNPGHFEIKHFANATGARKDVVERLASELAITPRYRKQRVGNVLAIVSELVARVAALPPHTRSATNLSATAMAVRAAILSATEPDTLLFETLPRAVGLNSIGARTPSWRYAGSFTTALVEALSELTRHYQATVQGLQAELCQLAREPGRQQLAGLARVIEDEIINPEIRSFVLALGADAFDDVHWIENVATVVTRTAPRHWTMSDRSRYTSELTGKLAAFRRLLVLHSEMRGMAAQPFDAQRITRTTPAGDEQAILISLDDAQRQLLSQQLDSQLEALAVTFGTRERAEQAMLAWVAEHVLAPGTVTTIEQPEGRPSIKAATDV